MAPCTPVSVPAKITWRVRCYESVSCFGILKSKTFVRESISIRLKKSLYFSGDLRRHSSKVHHQDHDLIACDDCNKVFATRQCLQNHKASHNRDHPHQERSFSADIGEESSIMTIVSPSP